MCLQVPISLSCSLKLREGDVFPESIDGSFIHMDQYSFHKLSLNHVLIMHVNFTCRSFGLEMKNLFKCMRRDLGMQDTFY